MTRRDGRWPGRIRIQIACFGWECIQKCLIPSGDRPLTVLGAAAYALCSDIAEGPYVPRAASIQFAPFKIILWLSHTPRTSANVPFSCVSLGPDAGKAVDVQIQSILFPYPPTESRATSPILLPLCTSIFLLFLLLDQYTENPAVNHTTQDFFLRPAL